MLKSRLVLILPLTLGLGGCALSGGRIGSLPPPTDPSEAGSLIVYRDGSWVGIFGTMKVSIDGKPVYRLGMSQSFHLRLDPGEYILSYSIGLNDCSGVVIVDPRQTERIRLAPDCMMYKD